MADLDTVVMLEQYSSAMCRYSWHCSPFDVRLEWHLQNVRHWASRQRETELGATTVVGKDSTYSKSGDQQVQRIRAYFAVVSVSR
jgi:hypothetical protein